MDRHGMTLYALILAGGSGTRLWPFSRQRRPKQLLSLIEGGSMLQATIARLAPLVPPERVFVLTNMEYVDEARSQLPDVPPAQVVGEPAALGTAPAAALGAALVRPRDPNAVLFMLPADHVIAPAEAFRDVLHHAALVAEDGWLVTFGVQPSGPESGYGYIELGEPLAGEGEAYRVTRFVEKPDHATAVQYLADGRYKWNSGMFAWTVETIFAEIEHHLPVLGAQMADMTTLAGAPSGTGAPDFPRRLAEIWAHVTDRTTIDYGIMEQSDRVACIQAAFQWSDVGSWSALMDVLESDAAANVVVGEHLGIDTVRSLVFARGGRLVTTVGIEDLVVVDTPDALLVCQKDRAQDVKRIVDRLGELGEERLL